MTWFEEFMALVAEHRECGKPKYDGCYAHFPWMSHCRADGMAWPCDVERLRQMVRGLLDKETAWEGSPR